MSFDGGGAGTLGSARGEIVISTSSAQANVRQLQGAIGDFGKSAGDSFKQVATGIGLLATSKKLAGIFTGAIGTAADFEQEISAIGAVADATGPQLDALREKALQIGKDTAFSATQGAQALEELAKAGVSVDDILSGAADGAVALAAAAGIGLPEAAAIIATSLNEFQEGGDQATRFADLFAAAASSSAASAQEIGNGFAYAGGQAHQLGISAEDLTTALAILADNGLGDRAGTSLNAALSSIAAPTTQGAAALDQLGVSAFDAAGNFKPLPDLLNDLSKATANLTQEQKSALLADIFGEQGARAIIPLMNAQTDAADAAGKGWEQYSEKITKSGAAAEQAKARMDNTRGSIEQLRGSVETFSILVGSTFLPAVRDAVDVLTGFVNVLIGLPHSLQALVGVATAGAAAIAGIAGVLVLAGPRLAAFGEALGTVRTAILGVNPLLLAGAIAIGLLIAAYKTNFGGFADFINGTGKKIKDTFDSITKDLHFFTTDFNGIQIKRSWGRAIGIDQLTRIQHVLQNMGRTFNKFNKDMDKVSAGFSRIGRVFKRNGFIAGLQATFGDTGQGILSNFVKAFAAIPETVGKALRGIRTGFAPIDRMFYDAGRALQFFGGALEALATGDFRTAFAKLAASLNSLLDVGRNAAQLAVDGLRKAASSIEGVAVAIGSWAISQGPPLIDAVIDFVVNTAWPAVKDRASDIADVAVNIVGWAVRSGASILDKVTSVTQAAWDLLRDHAIDIGLVLINIGEFAVQAGASIFQKVSDTVQAAWALLKLHAIDIGAVLVSIGEFLVSSGASILDQVTTTVLAAWNLVKGVAVDLGAILVSIESFIISSGASILDEVTTTVLAAWNLVKGNAIPLGKVVVNGTITFTESSGFTAVSASIGVGIVDAITGLGTLASDIGDAIAQKFRDINWLTLVTVDSFTGGQGVGVAVHNALVGALNRVAAINPQDIASLIEGLGRAIGIAILAVPAFTAQVVSALAGFFTGLVFGDNDISWDGLVSSILGSFSAAFRAAITGGQGLLISATDLAAWASGIRDSISGALFGRDVDVFGVTVHQQGFFDNLFKPFTALKLPDLPDIGGQLAEWINGEIQQAIDAITNSKYAKVLGDLANGDFFQAVRDLGLTGGSDSGSVPMPDFVDPFANLGPLGDTNGDGVIDIFDNFNDDTTVGKLGDFGTADANAFADAVVKALQNKKGEVDAALAALLRPPKETNDQKGVAFNVKNPDSVKFPAPNLTALTRGFADAVNATQDAIRRIVSVVNTLTPQFGNALQNAMRAFVSALDNGFSTAVNNTQTATSRMIGIAETLIGALGNAGANAGRSFSNNISAAFFGAVTAAGNAASALVSVVSGRLSGLGGLGYGIGQQLGFGMANGIASTISAVVSAAVNLVYSALAAARFAALIGSPSKLFAREVGEPIAQGMAVGIDDGHGAVKRSIAALIAAAIPTVSATSLASSPTSHAATLLAQPSAAAVSLGARSNVVNQNTFTLKTEFHGITDTDEIETRVHTSFFRAIDLAASAGLFGS